MPDARKHISMVHERRPLPFEILDATPIRERAPERPLAEFQILRIRSATAPADEDDAGFDLA